MKKEKIRIGFDLDGVILYNPIRIVRPIIYSFKKNVCQKRINKFYIPKTKIEKTFWRIFHLSSISVADGFEELEKLVLSEKIEIYLITARYSFLKNDLKKWLKKINMHQIFTEVYYNKNDEQPHLYKEEKIKKLNLDIFVEDNYDIVKHLNKTVPKTKIWWISNFCDRHINYDYNFKNLNSVIKKIKKI
jgi:uncharacterized HAD superfamily protein